MMMILQVGAAMVSFSLVRTPYLAARCTGGRPGSGRIYDRKVLEMTISKERKAELIAEFGNNPQDSGNPKAQVAIMSDRIRELTEHMKSHPKDFHTRRGLLMIVGRRRRLLSYIKKRDIMEYRELIAKLGIRDNIQ